MRVALACLIVLAACSADPPPPRVLPAIPADLQVCPPGGTAPAAPPPPRSVIQLLEWSLKVHAALLQTTAARAECAARLDRLNGWIAANLTHAP